ncbi:hypothetical protein D3C78_1077580 [compost metagenome]
MADFDQHPRSIVLRQQIQVESRMTLGRDLITQPLRGRIDQAAFDAGFGDHEFATPHKAVALAVDE